MSVPAGEFRRWLDGLAAGGDTLDWDPASEHAEFRAWIASVYAGNGAMTMPWLERLIHERRRDLVVHALRRVKDRAEAELGSFDGPAVTTVAPSDEEPNGIVRCGYGDRITELTSDRVTVTVADRVQDWIARDRRVVWPVCPEHGRGLHAMLDDGTPSWICGHTHHRVSTIVDG
ncbi:hypothetical protein BJY16_005743 [Actinoplanes octamycinicus]|uniref:Uncharacterized protein n=1 Tax=Actinoplanes octamycinicus TaxID=135948 RepID=A0A7W7H1L2_9ACTN|nr:hypothetical protein [Actinoplanes octamycinicus]MBB4742284.1 hypothetical protein [Actinoplanes octamycinicus]GIE59871.1 hypothetical protein Aoc01nite_52730 [Actinoplanes octamycinicus]